MSVAVLSHNPLQNLSCCKLLRQCEFIEIAHRIIKAVICVFVTIGQTIIYSVKWVLSCGRVNNNQLTREALDELEAYIQLPHGSPQFERQALKMASVWLTPEEMEDINCQLNVSLFSQIIVRAALLAGRSPLHFKSNGNLNASVSYRQFYFECKALNLRFNALSASDKMAILEHLDSELTTTKVSDELTEYRLVSSPDKPNRPRIPPPATISEAARDLWTDYKALAHEGVNMHHPIMKGYGKLS